MLKPAPTRLRLVLWSLQQGLDVFPEAPPPGLVTVPALPDAPEGYYARAGYRLAGERSIRIDMLERLADMLRGMDSRGGFEANADMLSITGLTLEQFANLMVGLGYQAERGERPKVKPVPEVAEPQPKAEESTDGAEEAPKAEEAPEAPKAEDAPESAPEEEVEIFYTFRWATKPRAQGQRQNRNEPRGNKPKGKRGKPQGKQAQQARPPRKDKPFDPDNPFAALAALKAKD